MTIFYEQGYTEVLTKLGMVRGNGKMLNAKPEWSRAGFSNPKEHMAYLKAGGKRLTPKAKQIPGAAEKVKHKYAFVNPSRYSATAPSNYLGSPGRSVFRDMGDTAGERFKNFFTKGLIKGDTVGERFSNAFTKPTFAGNNMGERAQNALAWGLGR